LNIILFAGCFLMIALMRDRGHQERLAGQPGD